MVPRELLKRKKTGEVDWAAFVKEYRRSLKGKEALLRQLAKEAEAGTITLLCVEKALMRKE